MNNTSKLPEDYRTRLNAIGIPADAEHVITPLAPLIAYLRERAVTHVYLPRTPESPRTCGGHFPDSS